MWAGVGCASLFVGCCVCFKKKNVLIKHSQHLRFGSFALCGFACACAYARCQAYGTDINHSAQQTNQLVNLALTGLMNLAANFRSTSNTKPDAQPHTTTNMTNKDTPSGCEDLLADRHTEHYFTFDDGSLAAHPYGWLLTRLLEGDNNALSGRAGWASYS